MMLVFLISRLYYMLLYTLNPSSAVCDGSFNVCIVSVIELVFNGYKLYIILVDGVCV